MTFAPLAILDSSASAEGAVSALTAGAQGDAVRALQQALLNQGIPLAGGVDGVFGAGTVKAVKQFQTRNGLNATGSVDDATSLALGLATNPLYGLKEGASGDAVKQLQQRLIELGITVPGGADGVFGAGTTTAVKQFQARVGYSKSGVVNAATAVALGAASTPAATPAPVDPRRAAHRTAARRLVCAQGRLPGRRRQATPAAVDHGRLLDGRWCRRHLRCAHGERASGRSSSRPGSRRRVSPTRRRSSAARPAGGGQRRRRQPRVRLRPCSDSSSALAATPSSSCSRH